MTRAAANFAVRDPETGWPVVFAEGDDVPEWAVEMVDNPDVLDKGSSGDLPPKGGPGSGMDAWLAYAKKAGVEVPADASRDDVIAAVEAAR